MHEKRLIEYITTEGKYPFSAWLNSKKIDVVTRAKIDTRLVRLSIGLPGDCESVGRGVYELKYHFGSGYRVYFAYHGKDIIVLFCGGDKRSQKKDIALAHKYWEDFKRRNEI